ncbi:unnamed protein product, partial [Hapterophycus canaliculatus]
DLPGGDVEDLHGSPAVSSDSSAGEAVDAGASDSRTAPSPIARLPWGRIAPSPDSSPQLRGPWGQLQEVMDEIKVISPSSPTSYVRPPFLYGARPSVTPLAEERKGFPRGAHAGAAATAATATPQGHPGRAFPGTPFPSDILDRQRPQRQPHRQSYRFPSPSPPRLATSPPTPAASAGNTPRDKPPTPATPAAAAAAAATAVQRESSRSPLSRHLYTVEQHQPPAILSGEGRESWFGEAAVVGAIPGRHAEVKPVLPRPGGALGSSSPVAFASSGGVAGASVAAGDEAGEASLGMGTFDSDDDARLRLEEVGGGDVAEELESVSASLPVEDTVSGRAFVGMRFIQAAEALSESPHLRRAAGAAATAVSTAAGSARVQFTYTSRKIGKVLDASAKSFEEFVDEQLQEDGSGQVLRREGGTGLLVPRGRTLSQAFIVAPGCYLCWEFRVKVRC